MVKNVRSTTRREPRELCRRFSILKYRFGDGVTRAEIGAWRATQELKV